MLSLFIYRTTRDPESSRNERTFVGIFLGFIEVFSILAVFSIAAMIGGIVGTQELASAMGQLAGSIYLMAIITTWSIVTVRKHRARHIG